jgi:4a-hydroxytetrahydrobiopterin dehydratase
MAKREKLSDGDISLFLEKNPGWERSPSGALERTFSFDDYAAGIGFAVRLGFAAERRDHHPDMHIGWRKVRVSWSTHDAGGITALDTEMAELTLRLAAHG